MDIATSDAAVRGRTSSTPDSAPAASHAADRPLPADGCYFIHFTPTDPVAVGSLLGYEGTLRVETTTGRAIASGDLYQRAVDDTGTQLEHAQRPSPRVPMFRIDQYRYYLRVTDLVAVDGGFELTFEPNQMLPTSMNFLHGSMARWLAEDCLTARMHNASADSPPDEPPPPEGFPVPQDFPFPERCFVGAVRNRGGVIVAMLQMGFVSSSLRRATIEIDRVPSVGVPHDNSEGEDWISVFAKVGWDVTVVPANSDIVEPSGPSWNATEGHAIMLRRRRRTDLDAEWFYYVLCVRRIDFLGGPPVPGSPNEQAQKDAAANGERGFMFDQGLGDSNHVPREGSYVAADWNIPDSPEWGFVRGKQLGETPGYFRTAVHETGHAMGLFHNSIDNGFMNTTENIAADSVVDHGGGPVTFPNNTVWSFAPDDSHRLRHWPDIVVRPGGLPWGGGRDAPVSPFLSDHFRLDVTPTPSAVQAGTPVRLQLGLANVIDQPMRAPTTLNVGDGSVRGRVIDASGTARIFSLPRLQETSDMLEKLAPGQTIPGEIALCQGIAGDLFPQPGPYRIVVAVTWRGSAMHDGSFPAGVSKNTDSIDMLVIGETQITVLPVPAG
jgi:hypothetical protein